MPVSQYQGHLNFYPMVEATRSRIGTKLTVRILIVAYFFPPLNHIASLRPYAWARRWSENGAQITVLTAQKRDFDGFLDNSIDLPANVTILEVPYSGPGVFLRKTLGRGTVRAVLADLYRKYLANGRGPINWFSGWQTATKPYLRDLALSHDVVVSTFGPKECHVIAAEIKKANPKLLWVSDYRDLWLEAHTVHRNKRTLLDESRLEQESVGAHSDIITTVSSEFMRKLNSRFLKPTYKITNGFFLKEANLGEPVAPRRLSKRGPLKIVYTGTLYKQFRDPTPLLSVLSTLFQRNEISSHDIVLEVYSESFDFLSHLGCVSEYRKFILNKGSVKRSEALDAQSNADILLLLESSDEDANGVLTGKVFEYLVSGRPILCLGSRPNFELGTLLRDTGTGVVFGPDELKDLPDYICASLKGQGIFSDFKPVKEEIFKYSRENSADLLFSIISEHLSDSIHGSS